MTEITYAKSGDKCIPTATAREQLFTKMAAELGAFIEALKKSGPVRIFESAYEKTFKEDILMCFGEDCTLDDDVLTALITLDISLDDLYHHWLDSETDYMDVLRNNISWYVNHEMIRRNDEAGS